MQTSNNMRLGMNQDIDPKYQPDGSYRYALNAVLETREGDLLNIGNELGNVLCAKNFPTNMKIVGHTLTDTDDIVIALYDPTPTRPEHQIGIYNPTSCIYTLIAKSEDFNFYGPVNMLFRVRNGKDRIIYLTSEGNPYRVANITDTAAWVNPTTKFVININKITLSPDYVIPALSQATILDGKGSLPYGTRSYYFQYLDVDFNPINRWLPLTNYIPVTYNDVNGADNEISSPFWQSLSSKAIQLDLTNVDITFPYYRLGVVKRHSIDNIITGVDVTFPIERKTTNSYVDTGSNIDYSSSIDEFLIDNLKVDFVGSHMVDKNRLYIGNLSRKYRDYSLLQRYASAITVNYQAIANSDREGLTENVYTVPKNFLKNDVVALGIIYHFTDGTDSPVQHIPGRAPNVVPGTHTNPYIPTHTDWDTDTITDDNEVLGNKRWQVYNTASLSPTSTINAMNGYLGYYEVSNTYTNKIACDGDSYWGTDFWGNALANTPIRHHKIPSNLLFVEDDPYKAAHLHFDIQLVLDNIEFPPDVSSYDIVIGEGESTIVDRGYLTLMSRDITRKQASADDNTYYNSYIEMDNLDFSVAGTPPVDTGYWDIGPTPYFIFTSPKGVYNASRLNGDYISIEKIFTDPVDRSAVTTTLEELNYKAEIDCSSFINGYTLYGRPESRINYLVNNSYYLDRSIPGNGSNLPDDLVEEAISTSQVIISPKETLQNRSKNHNINVLELAETLAEMATPATPGGPYNAYFNGATILADLKTTKEVYTNLDTITYKRLSYRPIYDEDPVVLEGGNAYGVFFDTVENYWSDDTTDNGITEINSFHSFVTGKFDYTLNLELRSTNKEGKYKYYQYPGVDHLAFRRYIVSKYYELEAENPLFWQEFYQLDEKYSNLLSDKPYFPLELTYDFCNIYVENNPFRIAYSQEDNTELRTDLCRQFKVNNYRDIPANTGEIKDLFTAFDEAYVGTPQTIYKAFLRPQTIQASGNTTYLGTGDILSLPFKSLKSPDFALGGLLSFKDRVHTEFGVFYVDPLSGRPFLLTDSINDLSLQSMRNFWEENGTFKLRTQLKEIADYDYPFYTTIHNIGYAVVYDPRFKRVIVHKKDYLINGKYAHGFKVSTTTSIVTPLTLWFNGTDFYYNGVSGTPVKVTLDNTTYFENRSFTISYSFLSQSWVSFHSYFPYYMMNDYNTFYSNGIYKHNVPTFQSYYGVKYPHIVDIVAKHDPINAKVFSSVYYSSKTNLFDGVKLTYKNYPATFDGLIVYNSYQTSGYKELALAEPFKVSDASKTYVSKIDNLYRLNDVRDITIDKDAPIWQTDWDAIKNTPYLDKIVNNSNINLNTSEFEQGRFRDYYLGLRFFFNNPLNLKITTDLITTNYENRNR